MGSGAQLCGCPAWTLSLCPEGANRFRWKEPSIFAQLEGDPGGPPRAKGRAAHSHRREEAGLVCTELCEPQFTPSGRKVSEVSLVAIGRQVGRRHGAQIGSHMLRLMIL